MLVRRQLIFWAAFGQLLLFHLASYWVVGFFYPVLMFLLLTIVPFVHFGPRLSVEDTESPRAVLSGVSRPQEHPVAFAFLVGFSVLQLTPRLFPGDVAVTGEGRMFALNMFDAPLSCRGYATVHRSREQPEMLTLTAPFVNPRIACDPIVYRAIALALCRRNDTARDFHDIDLTLDTRKHGQHISSTVVSVKSFCTTRPRYSVWRHNEWIKPSS